MRPATQTKHLESLEGTLPNGVLVRLKQDDALFSETGSTLWLGAQILSAYLWTIYKPNTGASLHAIELGSGTGLVSLNLSHLNFRVHATDLPSICENILSHNLDTNDKGKGRATYGVLDWYADLPELPDEVWPLDLIVTADSVYSLDLVSPLLKTINSLHAKNGRKKGAATLVALEVRDPSVISHFLQEARDRWGFECKQIHQDTVQKAVDKYLGEWTAEDWQGVEIWSLKWRNKAQKSMEG